MNTKKSFTIIELLVVVTIMLILLSIISINSAKIREYSSSTKIKSNLRSLKAAIEIFAAKNGKYPESLTEVASTENPIITEIPNDDFSQKEPLSYSLSPDKNFFAIWSAGKNRTKGALTGWVGKMPIPSDDDDLGTTNGTPPNENWN